MKRVKIMLTAIAVFAVVGGSLAFKAQKFSLKTLYTGAIGSGACATQTNNINTTSNQFTGVRVLYTTTTAAPVNCVDGYTTTSEQ